MTIDEIIAAAKLAEIIKDAKENPMPQTFDPALRKFVPSLSDAGAKRVVLYGPDGNPISVTDGRLEVNAKLTGSKVGSAFEIVPSDTTDLAHETIALYVGFDGDLKVDLASGETITMYNLAAGAWHPIQAKRVYATGTTATYILGAY